METKIAWRLWAFSLVLILIALVAVSFLIDVNTIGATGRFAWNAVIAALLVSTRGLDTVLLFVVRRRIWRVTSLFTGIGLGYSGNVILTQAQLQRAKGWHGTFRRGIIRLRKRWNALATIWKCLAVALMMAAQIALLPVISQYLLLIPIGFLIPVVASGTRRIYAWVADSLLGVTYWRYLGATHRAFMRKARTLALLHAARGGVRLIRMRYLCAWRLWKYDPQYRDTSGELWVSVLEPIRLWRQRKLDHYIGRPLFAGRRAEHACRSRAS